ncbi:MAG: hypothetical protein Q8N16_02605 [bacterium]|nr:hypothetical protein [bacterium]
MKTNRFLYITSLAAAALVLRFVFVGFFAYDNFFVKLAAVIIILGAGSAFVLRGTAKVIEETTEVLSEKTKLAGGLLQSFGTAFPDMVLGVIAALVSLRLKNTDYARAVNFAIIAAATTFGSNIYNIGHAAWCIFRQNLANAQNNAVLMFPFSKKGGSVLPINQHHLKPSLAEFDVAIDVSNALTLLTAVVAMSMVLFGQIKNPPPGFAGDLYQLIKPVGFAVFALAVFVLYRFRKNKRRTDSKSEEEENYYRHRSAFTLWSSLLAAGATILFVAESMVRAIEVFCEITGIPFVIAGVLAGVIGCLGEMIVIHNFSVNPKGRLGDAVVGVAMDNIVTILGASLVAIMGGIFLGGNALILIFVVILTLNTVLIWQISRLKNYFLAAT